MKVVFLIFSLSIIPLAGFSQDRNADRELLLSQYQPSGEDPRERDSFLFRVYQTHISRQILNDCIYDHSCSRFSKDVFSHFGVLKGLMLTADRLTRCNRASYAEVSPFKINSDDKVIDHWDHYAIDE